MRSKQSKAAEASPSDASDLEKPWPDKTPGDDLEMAYQTRPSV